METLLTFLAFYLVSVFVTRKWIQNAYSEGGIWERKKPGDEDVLIVIVPIVNLITLLVFAIGEGSWDGKEPKKRVRSFAKKFFNIKDRKL